MPSVGGAQRRRPFVSAARGKAARGLALVELLTVMAIVGALTALLAPAVQRAREAARQAQCLNNLHQMGVALHAYHAAQGTLPTGCLERRAPSTRPHGRQLAWSATILPWLDQGAAARAIDFAAAFDDARNAAAARTAIAVYLCPSTVRYAAGRDGALVSGPIASAGALPYAAAAIDYGGSFGAALASPTGNGVMLYDRAIRLREVADGAAHTLAVLEDSGRGWPMNGEWINGENIFDVGTAINRQQDNDVWSDHPGGAMALWCDGRAQLLPDAMDAAVLRAACTRAGDEIVVPAP